MITHVVVFWTDKPHGENRDRLLAAARKLASIPGVKNFRAGIPVPSSRGVVDESYAVAISMDFETQGDADRYQNHPDHHAFVKNEVATFVKRLTVYDFEG